MKKNIKNKEYRAAFYDLLSKELEVRSRSNDAHSILFIILVYYLYFNKPRLFYFGERLLSGMTCRHALEDTQKTSLNDIKYRLKAWYNYINV